MNRNIKLILVAIYILCVGILLYFLFSYLDLRDLGDYSFISEQGKKLIEFRSNNLIIFIILFSLFSIIWILLLGFVSPIAILSGYIFGPWTGTIVSVFSFTIGCTLLYLLAQLFLKELISNYLENKIKRYKVLFNKNEFFYFMIFRFVGGSGMPFAIQNILPIIFNMKVKNYFFATLLGLIPTAFILNSLGSGIEKVIDKNNSLDYFEIISSPDIYLPISGFIILVVVSFFIKKKLFKN